ncbi:MAG: dTDP-4-dehydrorhamnose reductase [Rhodanobacteraceae bacterium]|nr:MAG: dTDP-4-dehydrorhamnose reductase [Rhodanobacteraceae bacterium]
MATGANGQVGHELLRALTDISRDPDPHPYPSPGGRGVQCISPLPPGEGGAKRRVRGRPCEIIPAARNGTLENGTACERIDLADLDGLPRALDRIAPDLIVNAAAYTAVDRAEDETALALRINGDAVDVLGAWAKQHDARVVHYSTDYVFDGSATQPYREHDATHPVSAYGRSKLAGEIALRDSGARHLIFRTAWVYAARGHNFLRTMLRLGAERDELRVVDDQTGAPTPARLIAEVTALAIAQWTDDAAPLRDGVYHLVAAGQTSWCGFARAIFEHAQRAGLIERAPAVQAIRTSDYPTKAVRPAYSVLDTTKLRDAFGVALPDWQVGLDGVIAELANTRFMNREK